MAWKTTDTRRRLLAAAREEFLKHGYEDASLRRIAAAVGINVASVYSHFSGKEALFVALVEPIIQMVTDTFHSVDAEKRQLAEDGQGDRLLDRDNVMDTVLDFVYDNLEDVKLLLFCAKGTRYEDVLDEAAKLEAEATLRVLRNAGYGKLAKADLNGETQETIFLIMRHQYQTYAEAIKRGYTKARTAAYWRDVSEFYTAGWKLMLGLQ